MSVPLYPRSLALGVSVGIFLSSSWPAGRLAQYLLVSPSLRENMTSIKEQRVEKGIARMKDSKNSIQSFGVSLAKRIVMLSDNF